MLINLLMRLKITKTNNSNINDWQFMLLDENGEVYYIMNNAFYKRRNMKCQTLPKERDRYQNGLWIIACVKQLGDKNVIVDF